MTNLLFVLLFVVVMAAVFIFGFVLLRETTGRYRQGRRGPGNGSSPHGTFGAGDHGGGGGSDGGAGGD